MGTSAKHIENKTRQIKKKFLKFFLSRKEVDRCV